MEATRFYRASYVHFVINHIDDDLQHGCDDPSTAGTTDYHIELVAFI